MKRVRIDFGALALALEEPEGKTENFLDTQTGEIIKTRYALRWDEEIQQTRARVSADQTGRYVAVPHLDPRDQLRDMAVFARAMPNAHLHRALTHVLQGRRPFDEFKEVLQNYPQERAQWYQFKDERMRARITRWLNAAGIEAMDAP